MNLPRMTVVVESRLESVVLASLLLKVFCERVGASQEESRQIELCAVEALNNAVIHAYQLQPGHPVELHASGSGFEIILEIRDCGVTMPSSELKRSRMDLEGTESEDMENISENGRGLAIIKSVMDSLDYSTLDGTNRLLMTKRVSQPVGEEK